MSAGLTEVVMTMLFLFVILGATHKRAPVGLAPIAIGLCLTIIHLVSIPVTNTSVNPARSTGGAVYVGGWAIATRWARPRPATTPIGGTGGRPRRWSARRPA